MIAIDKDKKIERKIDDAILDVHGYKDGIVKFKSRVNNKITVINKSYVSNKEGGE